RRHGRRGLAGGARRRVAGDRRCRRSWRAKAARPSSGPRPWGRPPPAAVSFPRGNRPPPGRPGPGSRPAAPPPRPAPTALRGAGLIVPATEAASGRPGARASGIRYDSRAGVLDGSIAFVAYGDSADAFLVAIDSGPQPVLAIVPRSNVSVATDRNVDGSTSSR